MNETDQVLLKALSDEIFNRLGDGSIFELPWSQQVFAIIYSAQGIIDNGGFCYFFEKDWHDSPPYSVFVDAYREIGAEECAECIKVAAGMFPFLDPHRSPAARHAYLREHCADESSALVRLGDRVIEHSNDNFALLAQYARRHIEQIGNA